MLNNNVSEVFAQVPSHFFGVGRPLLQARLQFCKQLRDSAKYLLLRRDYDKIAMYA